VRLTMPASSNPTHVKRIVHELEQAEPDHRTDIGEVFPALIEQIRRRGLVVLISDLFVDLPTLTETLQQLRHRRHEVAVFQILHEHEVDFPFENNTMFRGLEIEQELLTEPRALRKAYLEAKDEFCNEVRRTCAAAGIDYLQLSTADPLDAALSSYLAFRQKTLRSAGRS
jgi:uncharacterized protein (DUF58 family)